MKKNQEGNMTKMISRFPFAHTFSVVARDENTGNFGVAVQSHWFSVGSLVPWAEAGVGAVATQSMVDVSYGPRGLALMKAGASSEVVLNSLLLQDEGRMLRQVAMVDVNGNIAVHTGSRCIAEAGHISGKGFSVQANMMLNNTVWQSMAEGYQQNPHLDFEDRLLTTLFAGQVAGGDIRGKQSAALLIVKGEASEKPWNDRLVDLRVEDHPEPLLELQRLIKIHQAYKSMNEGDAYLGSGEIEKALEEYQKAAFLAPEISELPFWQAVTMAESGQLEDALPIFRQVFKKNSNWALLLQRLPDVGLFSVDKPALKRILSQLK
jgi:uncharacterized Ntn-hydrolase superfamily protein